MPQCFSGSNQFTNRRFGVASLLLLLLTLFSGCASTHHSPAQEVVRNNYVIHLPGISGRMYHDRAFAMGLQDAGIVKNVEIDNWPAKSPGIPALQSEQLHEEESSKLAKRIVDIYATDPAARIYITAHSGGTGIAIWALEKLPANVKVERVILLASALSPTYDLSKALQRVDKKIINIYSSGDELVLGTGTRLLGSIDGKKVDAAGYVGFIVPDNIANSPYINLSQIPFTDELQDFGNNGTHIGPMTRKFARVYISQLITSGFFTPTAQK